MSQLTMGARAAQYSPGVPGEFFFDQPDRLLFASDDLEEVRAQVARVMRPHRLDLAGGGESLQARMHHVPMGDVSLSRLAYGAAVQIQPEPHETFFLVTMPLSGTAVIESGGQRIDSHPGLAAVINPDDEIRMAWQPGNEQVILRIARTLMERILTGHLGRPLEQPLRFDLGFRWRDCVPWYGLLSYLSACATQYPGLARQRLVHAQLEQMVASVLLGMHHHNYSEAGEQRRTTVLPRHVRRAQEYLYEHAHEPVSAAALAEAAGVSVRSLNAGFKEYLAITPMRYLRDLRLERVRQELLSASNACVKGSALRWGFEHMGRFSHLYKQRYGETPSQTLRRR